MRKVHHHSIRSLIGCFLLISILTVSASERTDSIPANVITNMSTRTIVVKGHIKDASTDSPLFGAKVQSQDKMYSAITDESGNFSIEIPGFIKLLTISAADYSGIEYQLRSRQEIVVSLFPIVPDGLQQSWLSADTRIQTLNGDDVRVISRSGTPAMGASMFIRGYNSLNAGAQPLIILDGVIMDNQYNRSSIHEGLILNPLSNISVEDIESIEVIKNATSIYGSKGGNGVVVINTKRGKSSVTKIAVSGMTGYNERPKTIPLLNADQFRVYVSDLLKSSLADPSYISSLPFLNDNPMYYDYPRYHNNNDWTKNVYRNSLSQSYDVSVSGGDDVALYNLSMGYADAKSTLYANDFNRFNARFNSDVQLTDKFNFLFDISYSQTDRNLRDDGFSESTNGPITSPTVLSMIKAPFLIPYEHSNTGSVTSDLSDADFLGIANPLSIIEKGVGQSYQNYLTLSVKPSYNFTKEFSLSGLLNYSMSSLFEKYFRPNAGVADVFIPEYDGVSKSFVQGQNAKQISLSANLYANWKRQFDSHLVDLRAGLRYNSDVYQGEYGSGHNTSTDLDPNLSGSLQFRKTLGYDDRWRSLSWYFKGDYSMLSKYFVTLIATADASSRFGADAQMLKLAGVRWGVYPSVSAKWVLSAEDFMKDISIIDNLSMQMNYGFTGNDNIPIGSSTSYFAAEKYINQYTGITLSNIGNTKIKPETVEKRNLGVDMTVLNNRLSINAELYQHITNDLLVLKQLNYISGKKSYWANDGKLQNTGFEISMQAKAVVLRNFKWELGGSISHYKNRILELPDGDYTTSIYGGEVLTSIDNPAGLFYGYKTQGVFATSEQAAEADLKILDATGVDYSYFTGGDIHFQDLNSDGIIDENDKTVIGNPNPDFTGSFNSSLTYKKFSLTALFTFSSGNDVYNYVRSQLESGSNLYNQSAALQNRWVNEGQNTSIPKSSLNDVMGNSRFSDRWIEDGSYLRFKTLIFSYEVPVNTLFLKGVTVWMSANNLYTFTKYLGVDPEFSINNTVLYQGIDAGLLSQGRSYFVGLKLSL